MPGDNILKTCSEWSSTATSTYRRDDDDCTSSDILVKIDESERDYQLIKDKLISSMGALGKHTQLQNIYRKAYTTPRDREKHQKFLIFRHGLETKRGDPNEKYAWYGAPKRHIHDILSRGFVNPVVNKTHGRGIHLSPLSLSCLKSTLPDAEGIRHLLFCKVLLGSAEEVQRASTQCYPSSEEFDSGVDSLVSPTKYIIWTSRMNTQILPEFMITFKVLSTTKKVEIPTHISALFLELSLMLPHTKEAIAKYQKDTEEGKITLKELQCSLRELAGDPLLLQAIKSLKLQEHRSPYNQSSGPENSISLTENRERERQREIGRQKIVSYSEKEERNQSIADKKPTENNIFINHYSSISRSKILEN